ncbi:hypothetical protein PGIN_3A1_00021 [Porphyromonas gingivalis]|nr:hypothetical protein PGIN_3A1_00021 [Porphyromonas gingivalis]
MKLLLYLLLVLSTLSPMYSQMLFSENLTMNIDSTKTIQGTILPVLDFKTEKENVFTFKNTANLNLLIKHGQVINLINKLEFSTYGNKVTVSGGYVHTEYRYLLHHVFEVYPYVESQWAESRGMKYKVSTGLQSRYRLVNSDNCLILQHWGYFSNSKSGNSQPLASLQERMHTAEVSKATCLPVSDIGWVNIGNLQLRPFTRESLTAILRRHVLEELSTSNTISYLR